jgi:hypothetical protein
MSETQDIRVWARNNGLDIAPKGKIPVAIREKWDTREVAPQEDFGDAVSPGETAPPATTDGEQAPAVGRKTWWGGRAVPREPRAEKRRVSIEDVVSMGWGFAAMAIARNPVNLPMARVLDMQAPVAGVIVNDLAKGTVLDKVLQPLARANVNGEKMMGLLGPPMIVGAITMKPELYPVLRPALKMSIISWMTISEPAMKRAEKKAVQFAEKFGGVDIDGMIDALFAPPPGYEPAPSEDEEAAIRRARGE